MTPERAQEIVAQMTGTCFPVTHFLEDGEDESDVELCSAIDAELFLCECCGWWFEHSEECEGEDPLAELTGGKVCENCASYKD